MSKPLTEARPPLGRSKVQSMLMVVDFPAPFGPRKPKTSPAPTANDTPSTAVNVQYRWTSHDLDNVHRDSSSALHPGPRDPLTPRGHIPSHCRAQISPTLWHARVRRRQRVSAPYSSTFEATSPSPRAGRIGPGPCQRASAHPNHAIPSSGPAEASICRPCSCCVPASPLCHPLSPFLIPPLLSSPSPLSSRVKRGIWNPAQTPRAPPPATHHDPASLAAQVHAGRVLELLATYCGARRRPAV